MSNKKLHKGLDSIFGSDLSKALEDIQQGNNQNYTNKTEININEILPNPYQPRKQFDEEKIKELTQSITNHGVFQPVLLRKSINGYQLVAGERRLRASKLAKLKTIPAIIVDFNDNEMMEISLLENIQRENLNIVDEALAYNKLITNLNYTQEQLAQRVSKSRSHITNILRLLNLPQPILDQLINQQLTMGHARAILSCKNDEEMIKLANKTIEEDLSVRDVENYINSLKQKTVITPKKVINKDPKITYLEDIIRKKLQTKVEVTNSKLIINYNDINDLNRILELINCLDD